MLCDFGFQEKGFYKSDVVLVKAHPLKPPPKTNNIAPFEYARLYFPHYHYGAEINNYLIPIKPKYHTILFPEHRHNQNQAELFPFLNNVGNAIKLAYICHANIKEIKPGSILLFYRSEDEQAITSLGIIEHFSVSQDFAEIANLISRRTVYSFEEIKEISKKKTKIILFRLIYHFNPTISRKSLLDEGIINGNIQTIQKISHTNFSKILDKAKHKSNRSCH